MRVGLLFSIVFSFLISSNSYANQCGDFFNTSQNSQLQESAARVKNFFKAAKDYLVERETILDLILYSLIAKEHIKLLGPPGTAKTKVADVVGKHILEKNGKPSFWSHQMTPETTLSETHGPYNFKTLEEENKFRRQLEEGLLSHKIVFIDEFFDGNPKTMRNILKAFNEREITEGTLTTKGVLETAITTSNKPLAKVYERAGRLGDEDDPAAVLDRDTFVAFVQSEFKSLTNELKVQNLDAGNIQMPEIYYEDLDAIRVLVNQVEVPVHIQVFLSQLNGRMKESLELYEVKSKEDYQKKIKMGEINPVPPYRKSKEYSPRTLNKANKVLRAMVVADWIQKGGQRNLTATVEDLKKIELMLTVTGPDDSWIDKLINRAVKPMIKSQLEAVKVERETFRHHFDEIQRDMNDVIVRYAVQELSEKFILAAQHGRQKEFSDELMDIYVQVLASSNLDVPTWETSGKLVGYLFVQEYMESSLISILGKEKFEALKVERQNEVIEIENQARKEAELRKEALRIAQEEEQARLRHDEIRQNVVKEFYKNHGVDLIDEIPVEDSVADIRPRSLPPHKNEYSSFIVYQSGKRPMNPIGHGFITLQNNQIIYNSISSDHQNFTGKLRLLNMDQAAEIYPLGNDLYVVTNNENSAIGIFNQKNPQQFKIADVGSKKFELIIDEKGQNILILDFENSKLKTYNVAKDEIVSTIELAPEDHIADLWLKFMRGADEKEYSKRFPTDGKNELLLSGTNLYAANRRSNNLFDINISNGQVRYLTKTHSKWLLLANSNNFSGQLNYLVREEDKYNVIIFDPITRETNKIGQISKFEERDNCLNNGLNLFANNSVGICVDKSGIFHVIHLKSGDVVRRIELPEGSTAKIKSISNDRMLVLEKNEVTEETALKLYKVSMP